ncbi:MAG: BlaI/MecI/CopY family transcriptional regulator [Actinobacteria bacterium]|nr:BlaI/MecI/CopY family transcriptional regulator [Actinomycetota bacterium]
MARFRSRRKRPTAEQLLGPLEAACMRALWKQSPASVSDVLERVNAKHDGALAYTTVMTVLSRLYDKGYLARERRGRGYDYTPRYSEGELVDQLGGREVERLVERYGEIALAHFVEALEQAPPDLVRRLRRLDEDAADG